MDDDAAADGARVDDTAAQLVVFTTTPTSTVRLALRAGACGGGSLQPPAFEHLYRHVSPAQD